MWMQLINELIKELGECSLVAMPKFVRKVRGYMVADGVDLHLFLRDLFSAPMMDYAPVHLRTSLASHLFGTEENALLFFGGIAAKRLGLATQFVQYEQVKKVIEDHNRDMYFNGPGTLKSMERHIRLLESKLEAFCLICNNLVTEIGDNIFYIDGKLPGNSGEFQINEVVYKVSGMPSVMRILEALEDTRQSFCTARFAVINDNFPGTEFVPGVDFAGPWYVEEVLENMRSSIRTFRYLYAQAQKEGNK